MKVIKSIVYIIASIICLAITFGLGMILISEFKDPKVQINKEEITIDGVAIEQIMKDNGSVSFTSFLSYDIHDMPALAIGFALYDKFAYPIFYTLDCQEVSYFVTIADMQKGSVIKIIIE